MMMIDWALSHPIVQSLGWTLLHFTWQGTLIAALLAAALVLLRGHSAKIRYAVASTSMLLMLALPLTTFVHLNLSSQTTAIDETMLQPLAAESRQSQTAAGTPDHQAHSASTILTGSSSLYMLAPLQGVLDDRIASLLEWLVLVWVAGVSLLFIRLACGWKRAQKLKKQVTKPLAEKWQDSLAQLGRKIGVSRPVLLYESMLVEVPTVIGWLRPVILVPASALVGLSPWHLEALLAHELAHVKRHDYLVNLLQTATEILLFYHPAVWWVSGQMRLERENVCDDLAVTATGNVLVYARALAEIESLRSPQQTELALAASGGSLLTRVRRLIETPRLEPRRASTLFIGVVIAVTFITITAGARTILSMSPESLEQATVEEIKPLAIRTADEIARLDPKTNQSLQSETAALIARDETSGEDAQVRRVAVAALGSHAGTVIVMDPQTGRVYTIVNQEWALRRGWNPASTIKLVTGLAGTEEKLIEPAQPLRFSSKSVPLNLSEALAMSNSDYFKFVGERIGFERFMDYARRVGLGEPTGINYAGEIAGRLPVNRAGINVGRLCSYGDQLRVTPIQLATLVSAIANGGTLLVPRVIGMEQESVRVETQQVRRRLDVSRETLQQLMNGMSAAVRYGTGRPAFDAAQTVAGKTGTGFDQRTRLGLFASYAPVDKPRLVVIVALRGANEAGPVAAGVAGEIYRALKLNE